MSFTRIKLCFLAFGFIIEIKEDEKKISFCVVKINKIKAKRMKNMKQHPKIVHLRPKEGMQKFFLFLYFLFSSSSLFIYSTILSHAAYVDHQNENLF